MSFGPPAANGSRGFGPPSADAILQRADHNKDGKVTKDEVPGFAWDRLSNFDRNKDGAVTKDEIEGGGKDRVETSKEPEAKKPEGKQRGKKKGKRAKGKKSGVATAALPDFGA